MFVQFVVYESATQWCAVKTRFGAMSDPEQSDPSARFTKATTAVSSSSCSPPLIAACSAPTCSVAVSPAPQPAITAETAAAAMKRRLKIFLFRLLKDGAVVAELESDNYGDFKFDKLNEDSGAYVVEITTQAGKKKTVEAKLGASVNLGEIRV